MEKELNMPTCLFGGPPDPNDSLKLAESQIGFMNIFARPLFEGVTNILPEMRFAIAELSANKAIWQEKIETENNRKMSFARGPLSPGAKLPNANPSEADSEQSKQRNLSVATGPSETSGLAPDESVRSHSIASSDQPARPIGTAITTFLRTNPPTRGLNADGQELAHDGRRHSSVYSRREDESHYGSRPGTADRLSAMPMPFQPSQAARDIIEASRPASPVKSVLSSTSVAEQSVPEHEQSLPSSRSQAESNATAELEEAPVSPSTKASSLEEDTKPASNLPPPPMSIKVNPYLHANKSEDFAFLRQDPAMPLSPRKLQAVSVYGPDVLAMANHSPSKNSTLSQITTGSNDANSDTFGDGIRDLRPSRSQSRLRGLRFWRKKPIDQTP